MFENQHKPISLDLKTSENHTLQTQQRVLSSGREPIVQVVESKPEVIQVEIAKNSGDMSPVYTQDKIAQNHNTLKLNNSSEVFNSQNKLALTSISSSRQHPFSPAASPSNHSFQKKGTTMISSFLNQTSSKHINNDSGSPVSLSLPNTFKKNNSTQNNFFDSYKDRYQEMRKNLRYFQTPRQIHEKMSEVG